jgi:hypothetical protein
MPKVDGAAVLQSSNHVAAIAEMERGGNRAEDGRWFGEALCLPRGSGFVLQGAAVRQLGAAPEVPGRYSRSEHRSSWRGGALLEFT